MSQKWFWNLRGQIQYYDLYYVYRENDKVIAINNIQPRTVEEAVGTIKDAGKYIMIEVFREPEQQTQPFHSVQYKVELLYILTLNI